MVQKVAQIAVRTYGVNRYFDLLKTFGNIERIVKTVFSEKTYFTSYVHNMFWANISYNYHEFYIVQFEINLRLQRKQC